MSPDNAASNPLGGTRLAGYELLERISSGAMGTVYKARQISMDRIVALKLLPPELARDRAFVERFVREARAAGRLNHPNIVAGLDAGEAHGQYFIAMEYVDGDTAEEVLRQSGPLPERRALQIAAGIARALVHAFQQGIVHRDIKPANIIIARDGTPKLLDLGTAVIRSHGVTDAALGTPYYTSPEQARGLEQADTRSDIYSLGATLYHVLVGQVPFDGPNIPSILARHISDPPPAPRAANPSISQAASDLVLRMMAKQASDRFQTPGALLEAIERVLQGPPATPARVARATPPAGIAVARPTRLRAEPPGRLRRTRVRTSPATGLMVMLILVIGSLGGAGWLIYNRYGRPQEPLPSAQATPAKDEARLLFETTKAYQQQNPNDFRQIRQRYSSILSYYPSTIYAEQATAELVALEEQRRKAAAEKLDELWKQAQGYMVHNDFRYALGVFGKFPDELYVPEINLAIEKYKESVRNTALEAWRQTDAEALQLWQKGQPQEALNILTDRMKYQIPNYAKKMEERIGQIKAALAQTLPTAPVAYRTPTAPVKPRPRRVFAALELSPGVQAHLLYVETAKRAYALIAQRQYEDAAKLLDTALKNADLATAKDALGADRKALDNSIAAWNGMLAAIPTLSGVDVTIGGIKATIKGRDRDNLTYTSFGAERSTPLVSLKTPDAATIAEKGLSTSRAEKLSALAGFLAAEGAMDEADKRLDLLKAEHLPAEAAAQLVAHIRLAQEEIRVVALFAQLKQQAAEQNWREAQKTVGELDLLTNNPIAQALQAQLLPWKQWVREGGFLSESFNGVLAFPEPGVAQVNYDFSKEPQLRDFEQQGGAWQVRLDALFQNEEHAGGWIRHRGRWLDAAVRFDAIQLKGRDLICLSVCDRMGGHVVLAVQGNAFSVRKGDMQEEILSQNMQELKAGRIQGHATGTKISLMAIARDGKITFAINNAEVATIEVPEFPLETVGAICGGKCAIDTLSIEGAIDPDWVADRLKAPPE